jgi:hypothetical protein
MYTVKKVYIYRKKIQNPLYSKTIILTLRIGNGLQQCFIVLDWLFRRSDVVAICQAEYKLAVSRPRHT